MINGRPLIFCVADGVYQFEAYMMATSSSETSYFQVMKNGDEICRGYVSVSYPYSTGW